MLRGENNSIEYLSKLSKQLNDSGYYSVLLIYHSKENDFLTKAIRVMSEKEKIKYMVAIRTYAISPEYLAMIIRSADEIAKDKIVLNIVSGDIHSDETSLEDIVNKNDFETKEKRLKYTDQWINKFITLSPNTELFIGGNSDITESIANKYNINNILMVDKYQNRIKKTEFKKNKKQTVCSIVTIRKTQDEANAFYENFLHKTQKQTFIFGTKDMFKSTVRYLEGLGVTDMLIHSDDSDLESYRIHDTIREMTEEQNGI
jgi:alkanesulfonate monooxygenase SsuD/methylene tetrahydromethanopterin reductase-like flavin-dependent oxidoreductase (luciferase family)